MTHPTDYRRATKLAQNNGIAPHCVEGKVSEAKYTPGPWWLDDEGDIWSAPKGEDADLLASCTAWEPHTANWEANARLIAAAPDLLSALIEIADESVFNQMRFDGEDDTDYFLRCFRSVKERARAAIAKALGQ